MKKRALLLLSVATGVAWAKPYWDPQAVPKDPRPQPTAHVPGRVVAWEALRQEGHDILRVDVGWRSTGEEFLVERVGLERSGTDALLNRAKKEDPLGSYHGVLVDPRTNQPIAWGSVGTGCHYRLLVRAMSFRFPKPTQPVEFWLVAENPTTGKREAVLRQHLNPTALSPLPVTPPGDLEVRNLQMAAQAPELRVVIYADGYGSSKKAQFFKDAQRVIDVLKQNKFPLVERFRFDAVFASSGQMLGSALDLGPTPVERNSFLGLYFPHWAKFGRWYHVVYPTKETKFRDSLGLVPHDYPIALLDSSSYWGVGNYNQLTAIPAGQASFTYLLLHEFGHFFGLNEEYEGGGPTELEFAPGIEEPWSQNITFLRSPQQLKWKNLISSSVPVPTPSNLWSGSGPLGAYRGGYADSEPQGLSHKPGHSCVMKSGGKFCTVCEAALKDKILHDLGR